MSLPRLLAAGLSAASRRLRFRSLSTAAASRPQWAMVDRVAMAYKSEPPTFYLAEPPHYSYLMMPTDLIHTSDEPGPDSHVEQLLGGMVSCSSGADGLLLVACLDGRVASTIVAEQGGKQVRRRAVVDAHVPDFTYLVCNPLTGQVLRVPKLWGTTKALRDSRVGILTQVDRGYGLPDRFVVAMHLREKKMLRFRSDTGKWDSTRSGWEDPLAQGLKIRQETVAFGGRLWWVDLRYGAISADPFGDLTETPFVELPKDSVLPEAQGDEDYLELRNYRRVGVSEGRLRYVEVSQREPFVLSSFTLDEESRGVWTLEHRVALSRVWAAEGGGHPWLPLKGDDTPQNCVLDPLHANVVHIIVGKHVVAVDMDAGKVAGSSLLPPDNHRGGFIPCVLGSRQIPPSKGKAFHAIQYYSSIVS
ncbi:hypothetical protein ACQ4PT_004006 [Festuca glaucescens]